MIKGAVITGLVITWMVIYKPKDYYFFLGSVIVFWYFLMLFILIQGSIKRFLKKRNDNTPTT